MRTQPQEIIAKLEADNSRLAKEQVILEAMEEGLDEFFEGVRMALDPLVTFGVKQVPEKAENEVLSPQGLAWPTFKELTRKLLAINIFKKEHNFEITLLFSENRFITLDTEVIEATLEDQKALNDKSF